MDHVYVVRHKVLVEGRTQRSVARELGLSRTTVGKYVDQTVLVRKAPSPRRALIAVSALLAFRSWSGGELESGGKGRPSQRAVQFLMMGSTAPGSFNTPVTTQAIRPFSTATSAGSC